MRDWVGLTVKNSIPFSIGKIVLLNFDMEPSYNNHCYRSAVLDVISVYQYNDIADRFERAPFSVQFRTKKGQEGQNREREGRGRGPCKF